MIRTDTEYREALERLEQDKAVIAAQRKKLEELKLDEDQVEHALEPALSFHEQLKEEVAYYEKVKRGDFEPLVNLTNIGRLLIGLRLAQGLSQRELAARLDVAESVVSRDENNEYHGITIERAQRVLDALGGRFRLILEEPVVRVEEKALEPA